MAITILGLITQGIDPDTQVSKRYVAPVFCTTPSSPDYDKEPYKTSLELWHRAKETSYGSSDLLHQTAKLKDGVTADIPASYMQKWPNAVCQSSGVCKMANMVGCSVWEGDGQTFYRVDGIYYQGYCTAWQLGFWYVNSDVPTGVIYYKYRRVRINNLRMPQDPHDIIRGTYISAAKAACEGTPWYGGTQSDTLTEVVPLIPSHDVFEFDSKAQEVFNQFLITRSVGPGHSSAFATAYSNAVQALPQAQTNMLLNVLELADSVKKLVTGNFKGVADLGDAWLKYRYVYSTTKSDLDEIISLSNRISNLSSCPAIRTYGQYTVDGYIYRCSITTDMANVLPEKLSKWFGKFGLRLTASNIWDAIPYSFIVDWFLHIGDFLKYLENYTDMVRLPVKEVWYSVKYVTTTREGILCENYLRLKGSGKNLALPKLDINWRWSGRTLTSRLADAGAIFFGR